MSVLIILYHQKTHLSILWDVSPGPLPPFLRNVNLQNDPLIVVLITVSRANGPWPKHARSIILANGNKG